MNITEIALATGFSDPSYFARVFREEVGVIPRAYQRREHSGCIPVTAAGNAVYTADRRSESGTEEMHGLIFDYHRGEISFGRLAQDSGITTWELSHLLEERGWSVHNLPMATASERRVALHEGPAEHDLQTDSVGDEGVQSQRQAG